MRSSSSNIAIPAPGAIVSALAEIGLASAPKVGDNHFDIPRLLAFAYLVEPTDASFKNIIDSPQLYPTVAAAKKGGPLFPPKVLKEELDKLTAAGDKAAEALEAEYGPVGATKLWDAFGSGSPAKIQDAAASLIVAHTAARWCATARQPIKGWPVDVMSNSDSDLSGRFIYMQAVQQSTVSCANLVAKIASSIGPVAYADQNALKLAVYKRLAAFPATELEAMTDKEPLQQVSVDMTGFQGQAFNTSKGRFENSGGGWTWRQGDLAMLDGSHVYGRAVNVSLASTATGQQRRSLTTSQSISAEAVQRATATVNVTTPGAGAQ